MSPTPPPSLLRITEEAGRTAVRFAPRTTLTEANAEEFDRALVGLVENRARPDLAVDLAGVDYLTSIALAKFVGLNRKVRAAGGRLTLQNPGPLVRQVFAVARLDLVLDIEPGPRSIPA